jgi:hypothetical protein
MEMTAKLARKARRPGLAGLACVLAAGLALVPACSGSAPSPGALGAAGGAEASPAAGVAGATFAGSCVPEFGQFGPGTWPAACWHPYGTLSPFNAVIPANPRLSSESTAIVRYMTRRHWAFTSSESGLFAMDDEGSRPVYWSHSSDPLVKLVCTGHESGCPNGATVRIPAAARPSANGDGHMTVVDQEHGVEWDFWAASRPENGEMKIGNGGKLPIGANSGTGLEGRAEAALLGLLGGLIRAPELSAGKIEHALAMTTPCEQLNDVWPSPPWGQGDHVCRYERPGPHFASLLQLNMTPAEIAATGAPKWQRTIMTAMAQYGVYVVDTGGTRDHHLSLMYEDDLSFTSFGYAGKLAAFVKSEGGTTELTGVSIPTAKFRVIDPCVPQKTC